MVQIHNLAHVNAALNGLSAIFILLGGVAIWRRNIPVHRFMMVSAFLCSTVFLVCYLYYHFNVGSVPFKGVGWIRVLYFSILIPHTILAALMVPLILRTLFFAWKQRFEEHRRIARWTYPIWLYVSLTGVCVYYMLYWL